MNTAEEYDVKIKQPYYIAIAIIFLWLFNNFFDLLDTQTLHSGNTLGLVMFVGAIFVFILTFMNFKLALLIFSFVALIVSYHIPGISFFFTPADAFLIVLTIVFILRVATGRERKFTHTFIDRTVFIFIILTIISLIKSRNVGDGIKEIVQTLEYFVFGYYLIVITVDNRKILWSMIHAILIASTLAAAQGIFEYVQLGGGSNRITGPFAHFNAFGAFLAMTTTFSFVMATSKQTSRNKITFWIFFAFNVIALLLSFSRGAWIGTIVSIIVTAQMRGMINFVKYFATAFVFLILFSLFVPSTRYTERFRSISNISDPATESRLIQYEISYEAMTTMPILGVGLSNNKYFVVENFDSPGSAEIHNLFLHIGTERGIPAMIVLMWIFISFYINALGSINRAQKPFFKSVYLAIFAAVLAFGVTNLFAYMLIRGPALYFTMFIGLYSATVYIEQTEPKDISWAKLLSSVDVQRPTMRMG